MAKSTEPQFLRVADLFHAVTAVHQRINRIVDEVCLAELPEQRGSVKRIGRSGMRELLLLYYIGTYGVQNESGQRVALYSETLRRIQWKFPEHAKDKTKFANCVRVLSELELLERVHFPVHKAKKLFGETNIPKRGGANVLVLTADGAERLRKFEKQLASRFMQWIRKSPLKNQLHAIGPEVLNDFSQWLIERWRIPPRAPLPGKQTNPQRGIAPHKNTRIHVLPACKVE